MEVHCILLVLRLHPRHLCLQIFYFLVSWKFGGLVARCSTRIWAFLFCLKIYIHIYLYMHIYIYVNTYIYIYGIYRNLWQFSAGQFCPSVSQLRRPAETSAGCRAKRSVSLLVAILCGLDSSAIQARPRSPATSFLIHARKQ